MVLIIGGAYQGKLAYAKEKYKDYKIINKLHGYIRESLEKGESESDILSEVEREMKENDKLVIITDEIGYGIVPIEKEDREYREIAGRICCELAKKADKVERIICGVSMVIKGES